MSDTSNYTAPATNKRFDFIEFGRKYGELLIDFLIIFTAVFISCGKYLVSRETYIAIDCTLTLTFLFEAIIKILYSCRIIHIKSSRKGFIDQISKEYNQKHPNKSWKAYKKEEWEKFKELQNLGTYKKLREGLKLYLSSNWNKFDFTITILALPSVFLITLPSGHLSASTILILRLFRMMRVFRLFHLIKRHKNGIAIMTSIKQAFKTSIIVIIGFMITVFVLAIVNFSLYKNVSPEYFGSPITSLYNTFRLFTLEGWYEIPNEISAHCSSDLIAGFVKLYFCTILFLGGIMGVSMVTSMFVDALNKDDHEATQKEIREAQREIKQLNAKIDKLTALLEEQNKFNNK